MNTARASARTAHVTRLVQPLCRSPQPQTQTPKDISLLSVSHLTHRYARGLRND